MNWHIFKHEGNACQSPNAQRTVVVRADQRVIAAGNALSGTAAGLFRGTAGHGTAPHRVRQFPRTYWRYLLATALFSIGNSSNAFRILRTQDIDKSLETTILIYAAFNLAAVLISYPAGSLSDNLGRKRVLLASFIIFTVAYMGFAMAQSMVLIAVLFVFYGLHQDIFRAVGKAFAADLVPEQLLASGVGWYNTTVGLVQLVASLNTGLLWDQIGHESVFLFGAAFVAIGRLDRRPGRSGGRRRRCPSPKQAGLGRSFDHLAGEAQIGGALFAFVAA
jgi:MFS family permease